MKKLIALLSATAILFSFAACGAEEEENITSATNETTVSEKEETQVVTEVVTNEEGKTEVVTKFEEVTTVLSEDEDVTSTTSAKSDVPQTKSEIVEYCNKALNRVKVANPGYTKRTLMDVNDDTSAFPDWIVNIVRKDETSTMSKGKNNIDDFPVNGETWASKLRAQDVESATLKQNGTTCEILIKIGTEKNPGKGTLSRHGRIMSVIDAAEAKQMLAVLKSIDMTYHDSYALVKIDSTTGNVIYAKFEGTADLDVDISLLGQFHVKNITKSSEFTKFVW